MVCSCRVLILGLLVFVFLSGTDLSAIIDEDQAGGSHRGWRDLMMATPESELKYEVFMKDVLAHTPRPAVPGEKYDIKDIAVQDGGILPGRALKKILDQYSNRELANSEIVDCIDKVTSLCRDEGYLTSYADFGGVSESGVMTIIVSSRKVGAVEVRGNEHFPTDLILSRLGIEAGGGFNLRSLQAGAYRTGRNMDRSVKLNISFDPADGLGLTDIALNVKDRDPVHLTFEVDNYGSWFINQTRYRIVTLLNNFTGRDDAIQIKMQWADKSAHELFDISYRLPLGKKWWWEFYLMPYKAEDYVNDLEGAHKRAWKTYTYLHYNFIEEPGKVLTGDLGFVHKHIKWEQPLGAVQGRDYFSALLLGFDLDFSDAYGRTIISDDFELGIPGLFGALEDGEYDASVFGADGKYAKNHLVIARRQKLFEGTDFLIKMHAQWADAILTGVNAFSVGGYYGIIDMRGYPRAQSYGENGYSVSSGFAFAPYFLPRDWKVPGSKATFFKSTQLFTLIDYAVVEKMDPADDPVLKVLMEEQGLPEEGGTRTLASAVVGMQMQLPEMFFMRVEAGVPLTSQDTLDGKDYHIWFRVSKTF